MDNVQPKTVTDYVWEVPTDGEIDFSFNLDIVPISEVAQLVNSNNWTGFLIVQGGNQKGQAYFAEGTIVNCSIGNYLYGPQAFYYLLSWKKGKGIFCRLKRNMPKELHGDTISHLLEGARLYDEFVHMKDSPLYVKWPQEQNFPCEERLFLAVAARSLSLANLGQKLGLDDLPIYFLATPYLQKEWLVFEEPNPKSLHKIPNPTIEFISHWEVFKHLRVSCKSSNSPISLLLFAMAETLGHCQSVAELQQRLTIETIELYLILQEAIHNGIIFIEEANHAATMPATATAPAVPITTSPPATPNKVDWLKAVASTTRRKIKTLHNIPMIETIQMEVMVIDDSMIIRKILERILLADPMVVSVTVCKSLEEAQESLQQVRAGIIALDVILPNLDGSQALTAIFSQYGDFPVVMLCSYSQEGMNIALKCLCQGALDFIGKPEDTQEMKLWEARSGWVLDKFKTASHFKLNGIKKLTDLSVIPVQDKVADSPIPAENIILLGGAMGAYPALVDILSKIRRVPKAAVVVVQYLSERFLNFFVESLKPYCALPVSRTTLGEPLRESHIYVTSAPAFATNIIAATNSLLFKIHPNSHSENTPSATLAATIQTAAFLGDRLTVGILPGIHPSLVDAIAGESLQKSKILFLDEWRESLATSLTASLNVSTVSRVQFAELIQK